MNRRIAGLVAALLCCGFSWIMVPVQAGPQPGQAPLQADIWTRLSLGSHGVVVASIFVHTAVNARCSAGESNSRTGALLRAVPRTRVTSGEGMARFSVALPRQVPAGVHWVSATCEAPAAAHGPRRTVAVQSSFSLPYDAAANRVPPPPPVQAHADPAVVSYKQVVTLVVRSIPGGLCTALVSRESANGVSNLPVDPFRVGGDGSARQPFLPTDFGLTTVKITCDGHKNYATVQTSFQVE